MYLTAFRGLSLSLKRDGNAEFCMLLSAFQSSVLLLCGGQLEFHLFLHQFHWFSPSTFYSCFFNAHTETGHISLYNGPSISGEFLWFEVYLVLACLTPIMSNPWMLYLVLACLLLLREIHGCSWEENLFIKE